MVPDNQDYQHWTQDKVRNTLHNTYPKLNNLHYPMDNVHESRGQTTMSQAPMSELYSNHASILIFIGRMIQVCSVVIPPLWIMETTIYHYTPLKFGDSLDLTWMLNLLHLGILIQLYTVGKSCSSPDISCTPPCISRDIYIYHAHIHQSTYVIQL